MPYAFLNHNEKKETVPVTKVHVSCAHVSTRQFFFVIYTLMPLSPQRYQHSHA